MPWLWRQWWWQRGGGHGATTLSVGGWWASREKGPQGQLAAQQVLNVQQVVEAGGQGRAQAVPRDAPLRDPPVHSQEGPCQGLQCPRVTVVQVPSHQVRQ